MVERSTSLDPSRDEPSYSDSCVDERWAGTSARTGILDGVGVKCQIGGRSKFDVSTKAYYQHDVYRYKCDFNWDTMEGVATREEAKGEYSGSGP